MLGLVEDAFMKVASHWDWIEMAINAIESGKLEREKVVQVIEDLMTDAANAEMQKELGE